MLEISGKRNIPAAGIESWLKMSELIAAKDLGFLCGSGQ
jgi:hypothetical protein